MWTFKPTLPGYTKRAAFEGEFFKGDSDERQLHGRTDALVREVIQNSLDAADDGKDGPVRVKFTFSTKDNRLSNERSLFYLKGLVEHLDAIGLDQVKRTLALPMNYLLVEDFGTRGLCGEPERETDPDPSSNDDQSFFWFWRNVGRSGKFGTQLGRWGLGKSVFPSASKINAFFGLTCRASDARLLLMGQAITRIHKFEGTEYVPEGYFHDPDSTARVQMPFEPPAPIVAEFKTDFDITRGSEPGLSVLIPYPLSVYKAADVVRSAIVHFFIPILRRQLVVEVHGGDVGSCVVERTTIREVSDTVIWSDASGEKLHTRPPFDLAEWALNNQANSNFDMLSMAGLERAPQWQVELFSEEQLQRLQKTFATGGRIAVRVPIALEMKDGGHQRTYFDAFLEKDANIPHGEDHFVREGMTISKVATLRSQKGARGLVLVDDRILSSFLGDAEGPAHTEWSENEDRPDETYRTWKSRLRFVKNSLKKLIDILSPQPEGLDTDLLQDIFSVADRSKPGTRKRKRKPGDETPDPPDLPLPNVPYLQIDKLEGNHGFRLRAAEGSGALPIKATVRAAYAVPAGNPFSLSNYSPFDFVFDSGKKETIRLAHSKSVKITARRFHSFIFEANTNDFVIEAEGFDPVRDLVVDAKRVED